MNAPKDNEEKIRAIIDGLKQKQIYINNPQVRGLVESAALAISQSYALGDEKMVWQTVQYLKHNLAEILQSPIEEELPELDDSVPESFKGMNFLQIIHNLHDQYNHRLETMLYFGITKPYESDITGIDNKIYTRPSWEEIIQKLETSHTIIARIKTFRRPTLLITPIAMPLSELAKKIGCKDGRMKNESGMLPNNGVVSYWIDEGSTEAGLSLDINNKLLYFPQNFSEKQGFTKKDLLPQMSPFPGWEVKIVEGEQNNDASWHHLTNIPKQDLSGAHYIYKELELDPITPEEAIMLHAEGILNNPFNNNRSFNSDKPELLFGAYLALGTGTIPFARWAPNRTLMFSSQNIGPLQSVVGGPPRRAYRI